MKVIFITLAALVVLFAVAQIYLMATSQGIEQYPYKVLKQYENFEVRHYKPSLFSSVKLKENKYENASSNGFRILAGYIFGGNEQGEKIAMTSPVSMSLEDSMTMMFMIPEKYNKEDLPKPNDGQIKFVEVPAKKMAAIRFGGWANDAKIEKYKAQLIELLDENDIKYTNKFYFFGYNAPYETVNRRNEVLIELQDTEKS